jgi:hypothetical protein
MHRRLLLVLWTVWAAGGAGAQDVMSQPSPTVGGEQAPIAVPDMPLVPVTQQAPAPIPVEIKLVETQKKEAVVSGYVKVRGLYFESTSENDPFTFRFDEWSLVVKKKLSDGVDAMVGALFYGGNIFFLEHAYVDLRGMPLNATVRLGVSRNSCFGMVPTYANRKMTNYGIVADMFTRDRIIGIQYLAKLSVFDLNLGLHNGYEIGRRVAGEGPVTVPFLADRDMTFASIMRNDMDENKEYSVRIGAKPLGDRLEVGLSGSVSKLSDADMAFLANTAKLIAPTETDRTKIRNGLDFMFKPTKRSVVQAEYYAGITSTFTVSAFQVLAGYSFMKSDKPYVSVYCRYGEVNPDRPADPLNPYTWKLSQAVASAVWRFTPGAQLQLEYEMNREKDAGTDAAGNAVKAVNDVVFLEMVFFY